MAGGPQTFVQRFCHPVEPVFNYLSDPRKRPDWQSSLRRIELLTDHATGMGARWRDVTWVGGHHELEVVTHEPFEAWAEQGEWRGITAYLALTFIPLGEQSDVEVLVSLKGRGLATLPAAAASLALPIALRSDLRRADRLLSQ